MAEQQRDVIEVLEHDHREVEQMFSELETLRGASTDGKVAAEGPGGPSHDRARTALGRRGGTRLSAGGEQGQRGGGRARAEGARGSRGNAHRLEKLDADSPAFDDELATLMAEIRHHIEDEEGQMFTHMRQVIDADELRGLGTRVEGFKKVAPTRPHPNVPNEPLPRMAAGPAASLFDRMRDLATGRGGGE
jgi:hypothetical protein